LAAVVRALETVFERLGTHLEPYVFVSDEPVDHAVVIGLCTGMGNCEPRPVVGALLGDRREFAQA
jgi:hypothetical protein